MGELTGTTFAGLEVRDAIGRDLVSTVYEAVDSDDARAVALRVVAEDLCGGEGEDRALYQRFLRRAGAALTFEHPNAPTIEEVGEHRGRGYLITPNVDTVSFDDYITQRGPLGIERAVAMFTQVADVLDAAHRAGLTHGAVNPTTLRIATPLDGPPTVQVIGFGIGALLELRLRRDRKHLRDVDELFYVAPEQLRSQPLTGRTDQYAMACALVHALTGSPPFVRDSVGGLFGAHLFVTPMTPIGNPSDAAILKGLAKEPRERYATCAQLLSDVTRAGRSAENRRQSDRRRRQAVAHSWVNQVTDATLNAPPVPASTLTDEPGGPTRVDAATPVSGSDDAEETTGGTAADTLVGRDATAQNDAPVADGYGAASAGVDQDHDERNDATAGSTPRADHVLSNGERSGPAHAHAWATPVENSSTAGRRAADMAYPAAEHETELAPATETEADPDDIPLLSEVLSRRPYHREPAARRPSEVLVGLVIVAVIATAIILWFIAS